jgi:hypothetical protein
MVNKKKIDMPIDYELGKLRKYKVYISGAITNCKTAKRDFAKAEKLLRSQGYDVYNPARQTKGTTLRAIMLLDIIQLTQCDFIYFLPTADISKGAQIEKMYAEYVGIREIK